MLVGATGSGKSTLVDGIVNYVLGVQFNDPVRFTLVQLEKEETNKKSQVICSMVLPIINIAFPLQLRVKTKQGTSLVK